MTMAILSEKIRGDEEKLSSSLRSCIASGDKDVREHLLRFVVGPEGHLVVDLLGRLPGRGMWVKPSVASIRRAVEKNLFARAAGQSVKLQADLATFLANLEQQLVRRCVDNLGLARKSGAAVAGFDMVRDVLHKEGKAALGLLLAARDGMADGRSKLAALATAILGQGNPFSADQRNLDGILIDCLDAAELAAAFGRDRVVHVVVRPGGIADHLKADCRRLSGLRAGSPGTVPNRSTDEALK